MGLLGLSCVVLSAAATYAGFTFLLPPPLPVALRGTWLVLEGEGVKGNVLTLASDGSLTGTVLIEEKEVPITGRVEVEGNRLRVFTAGPYGGVEQSEPHEILDLTGNRFVLQDSRGEVVIMERTEPRRGAAAGGSR